MFEKLSTVVVLLGLLGYGPAQADLVVEPFAGAAAQAVAAYQLKNEIKDVGDATGPAYGARIGYSHSGLGVGADYMVLHIEPDFDLMENKDMDFRSWGAFAAYEFPIPLRVWGSYLFNVNSSLAQKDLKGDGFKVGLGYSLAPRLSLNLEYLQVKWDKLDDQELALAGYNDFVTYAAVVSISMPWGFRDPF